MKKGLRRSIAYRERGLTGCHDHLFHLQACGGPRHVHLAIDLTRCDRCGDLTAADLRQPGARLEGDDMRRVDHPGGPVPT